jgi:hypothetical protein
VLLKASYLSAQEQFAGNSACISLLLFVERDGVKMQYLSSCGPFQMLKMRVDIGFDLLMDDLALELPSGGSNIQQSALLILLDISM